MEFVRDQLIAMQLKFRSFAAYAVFNEFCDLAGVI